MAESTEPLQATYPLRLEKELLDKSKDLAKKKGMSLAAFIRSYLIQEVEAEEKK